MNTRTFLKTLCLVPIGAVVEKLPGTGSAAVIETQALKPPMVITRRPIIGGQEEKWCWQAKEWIVIPSWHVIKDGQESK